jgi:hypothetical protein
VEGTDQGTNHEQSEEAPCSFRKLHLGSTASVC